mgnify:CR=1 FL=1
MIETRFKKTDIGEIPEDWEVLTFESLCRPNSIVRGPFGGALKKEIFISSGFKVYEQRNAIYQTLKIGDYYIDKKKYNEMKRFAIKEGDFIVSCSGTIGRIFQIPSLFPAGIINQALLKFAVETKYVNPQYFYYYFSSSLFQYRIIDDTQGGAMKNLIGMNVFRKTIIPIPPMAEQLRIAIILSDMDALLSALNKKIEKKRLIKQGSMQKLLTGKKRVTGFNESWVEKKLEEVLSIGNGRDYKHLCSGFVPVFGTGGILCYVDDWLYEGETVCIGRKGTINEPIYYNGKIWTVDTLFYTYKFINSYPKFVYYLFQTIDWLIYNEATGVPSLSKINIYQIQVAIPTLSEQTAIASILSDMDKEIEELEAERVKYEQVKQAILQQLLTGKIRLID